MRYIKMSEIEPRDLREYKKNCRKASPPLKITYKDMPKDGTRQQLARDQGYLCAYCMRRISLDPADQLNYLNIEHLDPQNQLPDEATTDFSNLLGVCPGNRSSTENAKKTCDAYRGILEEDQQTMRLNPLDEAQMDTIFYQRNGEIGSTDTELNKELSDKLNLNSEAAYLPQNRETAYSQLVRFLKAKKPIGEWSKPFLQQAWQLFCTPDKIGAYREYVGVYEYWLKHWMKK